MQPNRREFTSLPKPLSRVLEAELLRLRPGAPSIDPALDEVRRAGRFGFTSRTSPRHCLLDACRAEVFGARRAVSGSSRGLARANLLAEFDYLSAVSGGELPRPLRYVGRARRGRDA